MRPIRLRVASKEDVARAAAEISRAVRIAGPCEALITKAGERSEYEMWMRRYHKLVALIAEHAERDGRRLRDSEWDLVLKADFLPLDEVTLADGRVYHQLPSKKKLSREARDDFLNRVREFAAEYGIALQHPDEEER